MDIASYRRAHDMTQEAFAEGVGLKSKGYLSVIENGEPAPLRLALRIQQFTAGAVPAHSLVSDEDRALLAVAAGAAEQAVTA